MHAHALMLLLQAICIKVQGRLWTSAQWLAVRAGKYHTCGIEANTHTLQCKGCRSNQFDNQCQATQTACTAAPCGQGTGGVSTCLNLLGSTPSSGSAGRVCGCKLPTSIYVDDTVGCVDIDACAAWPCTQGGLGIPATCHDKGKAANTTAGRTCICNNLGAYSDLTGCATASKCVAPQCMPWIGTVVHASWHSTHCRIKRTHL